MILNFILCFVVGLIVGFFSCWTWKNAVQKKIQSEVAAMKSAASKGINRL